MSNTLKFDELMKRATELGEQAGKGKDTQIKFLLSAVEGGYHQTIDTDKNKHGTGIDDATKLSEAYVKAQTGATQFDAKAANQRKLISCVRKCVELGMWPKGGGGEPLGTVNALITHRQKLRQNPSNAKKLDDAANTLMRFARTQLKRDLLIDPAEFDEFCYRAVPSASTLLEEWDGVRKKLMNIRDGKSSSGATDLSPDMVKAIDLCTKRIKDLAQIEREQYSKPKAQAAAAFSSES